ncbi:hypothetical protein V6N13_124447 [Hibiscus sabdariffa]|uniref:Uncharacterized protein n=1 Tax=Hibiscus sabdariffa TaxID=183260 RepID=A0ABR2S1L4_9ROSI
MGVSRKPKVEDGSESEGQKWVLAMISIRAPLKPIYTTTSDDPQESSRHDEEDSSTPRGEEATIPTPFTCPPPAPRKPKPSFNCISYARTGVREFFTPPDFETVFFKGKG